MTKTSTYKRRIIRALRTVDKYHESLTLLIEATASTLSTLDMCRREMDQLDTPVVTVVSRYGSKLEPHPLFRIQRDAQATLAKNLKQLGLTSADLGRVIDGGDSFDKFMAQFADLEEPGRPP